jgi:hypothetical protein
VTSYATLHATTSDSQELSAIVPPASPIEAYLQWATFEHGLPAIYHYVVALSLAAHELAQRGFTVRGDYPLSAWFALVGDSASGKSKAIGMGEKFIRQVWSNVGQAWNLDPWVEIEGSQSGILSAIAEHYNPNNDSTVCLLFQNEFASMFSSREPVAEMLCKLSDGQTYQRNLRELQRHRKGGTPLDRITRPITQGLFATTEEGLANVFTSAHRFGGIFSRLWWIRPEFDRERLRLREDYDEIPDPGYYDTALLAWQQWLASLELFESKEIGITKAAFECQRVFFESVKVESVAGDSQNAVRLRLVEKTRIFAAIFATMRSPVAQPCTIVESDMQHAVAFAGVLFEHSGRMDSIGSPEIVRLAQRTTRYVRAKGEAGAQRRDIYMVLRCDKRTLDLVLEMLEDQQLLVRQTQGRNLTYFAHDTETAKKIRSHHVAFEVSN